LTPHQFPCNRQKYILAHESPQYLCKFIFIIHRTILCLHAEVRKAVHGPIRMSCLSAMGNSHETASSALPTTLALAISAWVWPSEGNTNEKGNKSITCCLQRVIGKAMISRERILFCGEM